MAKYDIIIKNGLVFDGKGNKPERVDIGVSGNEIKKIGDLQNEYADEIVDASSKYVCPGFIDLTNHSDTHWTIFSQPSQESLIYQGITTILGGNCGTSLAPFMGEASLKELGRWVDVSRINIDWQTTSEFLSVLEKNKLGVNFATLVGLNTVQRAVVGDKAEMPTIEEMKNMEFLLRDSLKTGAYGISTNLGLMNIKSFRDEELNNLLKIAKDYNVIVKHHLEDEGENILPSIARVITFARRSGIKIHITHFKVLGKKSWEFFDKAIEMIKNARKDGIKITCDFFPYEKTGSNLMTLMPSWFKKLPIDEAKAILHSHQDNKRKEILDYLSKLTLHYDKIVIASGTSELKVIGRTITDISQNSSLTPEEVILNLLETNNLRVSIFNEVISRDNIEKIAKEEFSVIASDGVGYDINQINLKSDLPHPRSFGAFPRALKWFSREKTLLPWEIAIYKTTGLPAGILGITDRGIIAKDKKADIVIFNPKEFSDTATYGNPFNYSEGIECVIINGEIILKNKELTGILSGKILKK